MKTKKKKRAKAVKAWCGVIDGVLDIWIQHSGDRIKSQQFFEVLYATKSEANLYYEDVRPVEIREVEEYFRKNRKQN
jgi:hypothetical protein